MMAAFFERLRDGLTRTRESLTGAILTAAGQRPALTDDVIDRIEESLLTADVGVPMTERLTEAIRRNRLRLGNDLAQGILRVVRDELASSLQEFERSSDGPIVPERPRPYVIMVVGVNGAGKTTTVGKLAYLFGRQGLKVLIGSGDTFRAAAHGQLRTWAERAGALIVGDSGSSADPAAVAFDAVKAGMARGADVILLDTAGRLHTKGHLMEELRKIHRVAGKAVEGAPHEVLLVLDATTGQNGLQQAKHFTDASGVTGIVLTKLDGTAKGGIALGIAGAYRLPIRFIGVGEGPEDLQPFKADDFVRALLPDAAVPSQTRP